MRAINLRYLNREAIYKMPHDCNGNLLNVGDEVLLRCRVKEVQPHDTYCNCTVELVEPMYPGNNKTNLVINTRQAKLDRWTPPIDEDGQPMGWVDTKQPQFT